MVLIKHHVTYQELHGVDKIVIMEQSKHIKLHARLRREGKCKIPAEELHRISGLARDRGIKRKVVYTTHGKNTVLQERFTYNELAEKPHYTAFFEGTNGYHLVYINREEMK